MIKVLLLIVAYVAWVFGRLNDTISDFPALADVSKGAGEVFSPLFGLLYYGASNDVFAVMAFLGTVLVVCSFVLIYKMTRHG